jgi:uncharacterized protein YmfQ (DUF2313 family)
MSLRETNPEIFELIEKYKEAGQMEMYESFKDLVAQWEELTKLAELPEPPKNLELRQHQLFEKYRGMVIDFLKGVQMPYNFPFSKKQ